MFTETTGGRGRFRPHPDLQSSAYKCNRFTSLLVKLFLETHQQYNKSNNNKNGAEMNDSQKTMSELKTKSLTSEYEMPGRETRRMKGSLRQPILAPLLFHTAAKLNILTK